MQNNLFLAAFWQSQVSFKIGTQLIAVILVLEIKTKKCRSNPLDLNLNNETHFFKNNLYEFDFKFCVPDHKTSHLVSQ